MSKSSETLDKLEDLISTLQSRQSASRDKSVKDIYKIFIGAAKEGLRIAKMKHEK